jgi:hypothetical protein
MFREHLWPSSGEADLALMCGPPGMIEHACVPFFTAMGYAKEQQVLF